MSNQQKIKDYILENFLFSDDQSALKEDDSFMSKGIVDSTGMLEIIYFLEDEFGVQVAEDEMVPENLDSVNNLVAFLAKKQ